MLLEGVLEARGDLMDCRVGDLRLKGVTTSDESMGEGDKVTCVLRPEGFNVRCPMNPATYWKRR